MRANHLSVSSAALMAACGFAVCETAGAADFGVYGEAGTFGLGVGVATQFNEQFGARLGYSRYTLGFNDYEAEDLSFDADATIGASKLLFDWHPTRGTFRVTAGAMLNQTKATAVAVPTAGGYTINDTFYTAAQVGSANGRVDFDRFAPYVGVGFGRALDTAGRFNVLVDIGAAFVGDPDVSLAATCGSSVPTVVCTRIQQDIDAEQAEVEDDADVVNIWPHINVAFSWRF